MKNIKKISIVVPCYNESANIPSTYQAIQKHLAKLDRYHFELIFVNDGSKDLTLQSLIELKNMDNRVTVLDLARNFGKEAALSAGITHATGHAVIMLDADLQHPPKLLPQFIRKWEEGADVVVGVRKANSGEGVIKRYGSVVFYRLLDSITDFQVIPGATDYRLIDRVVVDEFVKLTERNRITRGLIDWLGFEQQHIYFTADPRKAGSPGYSTVKLLRLAINSIVSLSLFPLRIAGYMGIIITLLSGSLGLFVFIHRFVLKTGFGLAISGTDMLAIMLLFMSGIILICLGFIALYIAHIHHEVINRPLYIIRRKNP